MSTYPGPRGVLTIIQDYNTPGPKWGTQPVITYNTGDTIDVQWCVDANGDHGGMFTYRICQDQALVDKLLIPGYIPSVWPVTIYMICADQNVADAEKQAAEDCFEAGILKCTDVSGQTCDYNTDCQDAACKRNDW